jgi:ATP-dependent RNA helicase RhlE
MSDEPTFAALGASDAVVRALEERGITSPFPIQRNAMPDAIEGSDVLAKSPTGSGKTLAFAIPIVESLDPSESRPSALVLVPTRELAAQVAEEFGAIAQARGLKVGVAYGGVAIGPQAKHAAESHILVATPGRLTDLVERRLVSLKGVRIFVLDEADRMLDMGFKPQVDRIVRKLTKERQTMFFSATLDGEVGIMASSYTRNACRHSAEPLEQIDESEVEHRFVPVTPENKVDTLMNLLEGDRVLALVFVRTKRGAERLETRLRRNGVTAVSMHGDKTQGAREQALKQFESGKVSTLVATDVAARGLDLSDVTHVINYDPPEQGKDYVHRVGRTGRAGRSGIGITLVLPEQQSDMSRVAAVLGHADEFTREGMTVAPARLVYTSRRRSSRGWGPPRVRRKA